MRCDEFITLGHGAGGTTMRALIRERLAARFGNGHSDGLADAAVLDWNARNVVITTDSFVVQPIEFCGGDIGKLAVCGTVNDLVVMGAEPRFFSLGLILEEGLALATLDRILESIAYTAQCAGVRIVTGDTKVVPRGQCDGIYINTTGIGSSPLGFGLSREGVCAGDAIILSGTAGDHAIAILGARDGFQFEAGVSSDCAPLVEMIGSVLKRHSGVKWMRDPTRGGVAAVLDELAQDHGCGVFVRESDVPVSNATRAVCDLLGFDPMHLANEGKAILVVAQAEAEAVLETLRHTTDGARAARIGEITAEYPGVVRVQTALGGVRRLQRPSGELLPRIC